MPVFDRHFTLEEARALLPWVRDRLDSLIAAIQAIEKRGFQVFGSAVIEMELEEVGFSRNGDGSHQFPREYLQILQIVEELLREGIQIKSPREGLIDFPAITPWGEEVFLCYLHGESDILYWHSIDGGFRGRRPVEGIFTESGSPPGT